MRLCEPIARAKRLQPLLRCVLQALARLLSASGLSAVWGASALRRRDFEPGPVKRAPATRQQRAGAQVSLRMLGRAGRAGATRSAFVSDRAVLVRTGGVPGWAASLPGPLARQTGTRRMICRHAGRPFAETGVPSPRQISALPATASFLLRTEVLSYFLFSKCTWEFHSYGSPAHPYGALSLDFLASLGTSAPDLKTTHRSPVSVQCFGIRLLVPFPKT